LPNKFAIFCYILISSAVVDSVKMTLLQMVFDQLAIVHEAS